MNVCEMSGLVDSPAAGVHDLEASDAGRLAIGDLLLQEVAARYGTPLYIIDGEALTQRIESLRHDVTAPAIRLYYSIKANPSLAILKRCLESGLGLDACSPGDVHLAYAAGAAADQISYTGVGLSEEEIQALVSRGLRLNLDSLSELRRFARVAPGRPVGLRVAPGVEAGFHPQLRSGLWGGKFGVDPVEVSEAREILRNRNCRLCALHTHLGSSIGSERAFLQALDVLLELAGEAPEVATINLGGGLAARYHPDDSRFPLGALRAGILERLDQFEAATGRRVEVELEPGEFLVSEAAYLLCRVAVTKCWSGAARESVHVAITDASMNLMPAHSLYGTYFHVYVDGKNDSGGLVPYDLYGCTNQTGDRLAQGRFLPPLAEGDLLVLRNAGAYAYCRSTQFNERPRPGELWIEDGRAQMVRDPEPLELLTHGQRVAVRE